MSSELNFSFNPGTGIKPLLEPGERLVWSGSPIQGLRLMGGKTDFFIFLFSIILCTVLYSTELSAYKAGNYIFFVLCFPLDFFALFLLFGRYLFDVWRRNVTNYAITDRRLICRKPVILKIRTLSLPYINLKDVNIEENEDGSGTLSFNIHILENIRGNDFTPMLDNYIPPFSMMSNVRHVYDLIAGQRTHSFGFEKN